MPGVRFYTITNARFFIGTACLVNSLRLTGNAGEVLVLDLGLTEAQRRRLEPHVTLVAPPQALGGVPTLFKAFPHLIGAEGNVVVIDGDMIVTRSLEPLVALLEQGKVCLFSDIEDQRRRWFTQWQDGFALEAPLRRQPYLNGGFVAFSTERWPRLLERWWKACKRIPPAASMAVGADYEQPFWGGDQDAINALLMSELPPEAVVALPEEEGPSADLLGQVRVTDEAMLACSFRGRSPYLLHYWGGPKPWERQAWMRVRRNAYVRLMPRVLLAPDAPLRLAPQELPRWLRPGPAGAAELRALSALNGATRGALRRAPAHGAQRVAALRRRLVR